MQAKTFLVEQSSFRNCNFSCKYCSPNGEKCVVNSMQLAKAIENESRVNAWLKANVEPTIFKISGNGEITMHPDFPCMFYANAQNILITNGSMLDTKNITMLSSIDAPLTVQFSLDGITRKANGLRISNPRLQEHVVGNLVRLLENRFPVEINCVLTAQNAPDFPALLDWVVDLRDRNQCNVKLMPLPVRPFKNMESSCLFSTPESTTMFRQALIEDFSTYADVLPPFPYLEAACAFMHEGKRTIQCIIPEISIIVGTDNAILWCGCGSKRTYGSVFNGGLESRLSKPFIGSDACCHHCFTHHELLNLFMLARLKITDLATMPSYAIEQVQEDLKHVKMVINNVSS